MQARSTLPIFAAVLATFMVATTADAGKDFLSALRKELNKNKADTSGNIFSPTKPHNYAANARVVNGKQFDKYKRWQSGEKVKMSSHWA